MNGQTWFTLIVSALSDFIISAGGALTTAMVATQSTQIPTAAVLLFAIVTGSVAAARRLQALLATPPGSEPSVTKTTEMIEHTVTLPAKKDAV